MSYDNIKALYNLLPPGTCFTPDIDSNTYKLISALAQEPNRTADIVSLMISEANPSTMNSHNPMLDVRYLEAGLPDPCRGKPDSRELQKAEVIGRWSTRGGASVEYLNSVLEAYGYDAIVTEYEYPNQFGPNLHKFKLNYVVNGLEFMKVDSGKDDDRIEEVISQSGITCLIERLKPAHTNYDLVAFSNTWDMRYTNTLTLDFTTGTMPMELAFGRISTATYVDNNGNIGYSDLMEPRFDHDPITFAPKGLLIEGPRTNFFHYTEDMSNAYWGKANLTINSNAGISPDGFMTADKITCVTGLPTYLVGTGISLAYSDAVTFSGFIKNDVNCSLVEIKVSNYYNDNDYIGFTFNPITGEIYPGDPNFESWIGPNTDPVWGEYFTYTSPDAAGLGFSSGQANVISAAVTPYKNNWFRFEITGYPYYGDGPTTCNARINFIVPADVEPMIYSSFLWGLQLEEGHSASSYIPATGNTTASRGGDDVWWNDMTPLSNYFNLGTSSFNIGFESNRLTISSVGELASLITFKDHSMHTWNISGDSSYGYFYLPQEAGGQLRWTTSFSTKAMPALMPGTQLPSLNYVRPEDSTAAIVSTAPINYKVSRHHHSYHFNVYPQQIDTYKDGFWYPDAIGRIVDGEYMDNFYAPTGFDVGSDNQTNYLFGTISHIRFYKKPFSIKHALKITSQYQ